MRKNTLNHSFSHVFNRQLLNNFYTADSALIVRVHNPLSVRLIRTRRQAKHSTGERTAGGVGKGHPSWKVVRVGQGSQWEEASSWNRQAVPVSLPPGQGSVGFSCRHRWPEQWGAGQHPLGEPTWFLVLLGSRAPVFSQLSWGRAIVVNGWAALWLLISAPPLTDFGSAGIWWEGWDGVGRTRGICLWDSPLSPATSWFRKGRRALEGNPAMGQHFLTSFPPVCSLVLGYLLLSAG